MLKTTLFRKVSVQPQGGDSFVSDGTKLQNDIFWSVTVIVKL